MNVLVPRPGALSEAFPAILQRAGKAACFAADEFFKCGRRRGPNRHPRTGLLSADVPEPQTLGS